MTALTTSLAIITWLNYTYSQEQRLYMAVNSCIKTQYLKK